VDTSLRPARRSGLTNPDPVRTTAPQGKQPRTPPTPDHGPRTSRTKGERTNAHAPNHLLNQSWR
jgi:hypothetical protein